MVTSRKEISDLIYKTVESGFEITKGMPFSIKYHYNLPSINIKVYHLDFDKSLNDEERQFIYDELQELFFKKAALIAKHIGYRDVVVEGRTGGWIRPYPAYLEDLNKPHSLRAELEIDKFLLFNSYIEKYIKLFRFILPSVTPENINTFLEELEDF